MPKISLALSLLLICFFFASKAQDTICVYNIKGNVSYKNEGKKWLAAKDGMILFNSSWINVSKGASVLLIKKDGYKTINVKRVSRIGEIIFEKNPTELQRLYSAFFKILKSNPMKQSAVISRLPDEYSILFPALDEVLLSDTVIFNWKKAAKESYYFLLTEVPYKKGNWLCKKRNVSDTFLSFPSNNDCGTIRFDINKKYQWGITNPGSDNVNLIGFSFADASFKNLLQTELNTLDKYKQQTESELYILLKALNYENLKLYSEAQKIYSEGVKLYPFSSLITDNQAKFMLRIEILNGTSK